eukprot:COSAG01_NODE_69841_length_260_cov_0.645963_1_plen_47_part_01
MALRRSGTTVLRRQATVVSEPVSVECFARTLENPAEHCVSVAHATKC